LIDRPQGGERAVLVHVDFDNQDIQEDLAEFQELVISAGAIVLDVVRSTRSVPDVKFFIGSGKAQTLMQAVKAFDAEIVIVNHALSPAQARNLEKLISCRVVDRTSLILDIFAQRARSFEGKLQVELAQLKHMSSRLIRGWTHLERQGGGIGLKGPGETQLETDRRLIKNRIKLIAARLDKVKKQRALSRRGRQKAQIPTVALVGYTNAGKSTLFNCISAAEVFAADQLFATLDPTLRKIHIPEIGEVIVADTVGFIRHLPPDLIDAFSATLEEVSGAHALLHVVDLSANNWRENMAEVDAVLAKLGADTIPQISVFNKIDLCAQVDQASSSESTTFDKVWVSAQNGLGIERLTQALTKILAINMVEQTIMLQPEEGKLRASLYARDAVLSETIDEAGQFHLHVRLSANALQKLINGK